MWVCISDECIILVTASMKLDVRNGIRTVKNTVAVVSKVIFGNYSGALILEGLGGVLIP